MAEAMKCDACREYYDCYNENSSDVGANGLNIVQNYANGKFRVCTGLDVCPTCLGKIKDYIDSLYIPPAEPEPPIEPGEGDAGV